MDIEIKLVDETTDLSNVKPYNWDVMVKGKPYYVCRLEGYYHSIGGHLGNNNLWCYPRDQKPTVENLYEFAGASCQWGVIANDNNYYRCKWDEAEVLHNHSITITRNGEEFFTFHSGGLAYGLAKAQVIIAELDEHPLDLNEIGYDEKMIGRKVWWRSQPAIVDRFIKGQACVMLIPDGMDSFKIPEEYKNEDYEENNDIKTEIFDKHIWWFRE